MLRVISNFKEMCHEIDFFSMKTQATMFTYFAMGKGVGGQACVHKISYSKSGLEVRINKDIDKSYLAQE